MKKKLTGYDLIVRRLLDDAGITPYRLAKISGVSASQISRILAGEREPGIQTLERLLRAAGRDWAWLDENKLPVQLPDAN